MIPLTVYFRTRREKATAPQNQTQTDPRTQEQSVAVLL